MNIQTYRPGDIIMGEGTHGDDIYKILRGQVLICKETGTQQGRIPIANLGVGDIFGEAYLLNDSELRTASAVAQSEVSVQIIPKAEMMGYLEQTPEVVRSMLYTLNQRLEEAAQENATLKYRQGLSPVSRLARLLGA